MKAALRVFWRSKMSFLPQIHFGALARINVRERERDRNVSFQIQLADRTSSIGNALFDSLTLVGTCWFHYVCIYSKGHDGSLLLCKVSRDCNNRPHDVRHPRGCTQTYVCLNVSRTSVYPRFHLLTALVSSHTRRCSHLFEFSALCKCRSSPKVGPCLPLL